MADPAPASPSAAELGATTRGPGFAAGIGVVMVLLSTSMAVVSGVLLYRGDAGDPVQNTLPAGCAMMAVAERPVAAQRLLAATEAPLPLPEAVTAWLAGLRTAATEWGLQSAAGAALPRGLDGERPAGVCLRTGARIWSLGPQAGATEALLSDLAPGLGGGAWQASQSVGGFVDYALRGEGDAAGAAARAAALAGPERVQVMVGPPDPGAALAALVPTLAEGSARSDLGVRSAFERVGAGALQIYHDSETTRAHAALLAGIPPLQDFVARFALWLGVSLRDDLGDGRVHGHLHVGCEQAGATVLKRVLDAGVPLATSAALRGAAAGATIRLQPDAFAPHLAAMGQRGPLPALRTALEAAGGPTLSALWPSLQGTFILRVARASEAAPVWWIAARLRPGAQPPPCRRDGLAPSAPSCLADAEWFALAPGPKGAEAALLWLRQHPGADPDASDDRARILDDSFGAFIDDPSALPGLGLPAWQPLEAEAIWLDTGLILHLAYDPRPAAAR